MSNLLLCHLNVINLLNVVALLYGLKWYFVIKLVILYRLVVWLSSSLGTQEFFSHNLE